MDFEIYYITLYLENEKLYNERLNRDGKAIVETSKFSAENSIGQQRVYLQMADEIQKEYPNIKVLKIANDREIEIVKQELKEKIGF